MTDSTLPIGIGGYSTISNLDLIFAMDYKSVGKIDHLLIYRPGSGICWIVENQNQPGQSGLYQPVYQSGDPAAPTNGTGIGHFDLAETVDRGFAFDLEGSGKLDDLVFYRPGQGIVFILQNSATNPETFSVAFSSSVNAQGVAQGIGGYSFSSPADLMFAYDLEGSGKMDDLVCYRPGTGMIWILQNSASQPGNFSVAYTNGLQEGIGDYDLMSTADRAMAFDYEGSGKADDLALYRPGGGVFWIVQNQHTTPATFKLPYPQPQPTGIGGYDFASPLDKTFAFDFESNGCLDDLICFRPGQGTIFVLQNTHAAVGSPPNFTQAFKAIGNPPYSVGIEGFDFLATVDLGIAFDFSGVGHMDYPMFYRPGTGAITILKNSRKSPDYFDASPYQVGLSSVEQVAQNLADMRALNIQLYNNANFETLNAYLLLTGNENNTQSWGVTVGLQILTAVFWAGAGALGALGPIAGAAGSFVASFVPGMIQAWVTADSAPGIDVNDSAAGLIQVFLAAETALDQGLGALQNDVEGNWNQSYQYNSVTGTLKDLANTTTPTGGPIYNALYNTMSTGYLTQIWSTILKDGYKVTQFDSYSGLSAPPDATWLTSYYAKNPSYCMTWDQEQQLLYVRNLGTGVSEHYPIGGDGGLNEPSCTYLFGKFDRQVVFLSWGIPVGNFVAAEAPGPAPPIS